MISPKISFALAATAALAITACSSGSGGYERYPTAGRSHGKYASRSADNGARTTNTGATNAGGFSQWQDTDPQYRLLPGDQLDIIVYSAPELSRLLLVAPDGRVQMPLAPPVMAANLTIDQLKQRLSAALASQLINPAVEITPRAFGSQRIYVGGEVGQPGVFELPGQIGVLEALMMAGGPRETAKVRRVILVRRHPDGGTMMKVINMSDVIHRGGQDDSQPLQRGDVVVVPRSNIAELNLFMRQYIRDALPISFGFTYDLSGNRN